MANFSTWDRATLEQFAQEATDKLVAMAEAQPVAWMHKDDPLYIVGAAIKNGICKDSYADYTVPLYTSAPTIPEGWQLVPVEPTDEMIEASRNVKRIRLLVAVAAAKDGKEPNVSLTLDTPSTEEYRAMLAAAPKHKETE